MLLYPDVHRPAISTIHAVLDRHGLVKHRKGRRNKATLCHELMLWSGAKSRLARGLTGRFGNEAYAIEELVAELGSAFFCADLSL